MFSQEKPLFPLLDCFVLSGCLSLGFLGFEDDARGSMYTWKSWWRDLFAVNMVVFQSQDHQFGVAVVLWITDTFIRDVPENTNTLLIRSTETRHTAQRHTHSQTSRLVLDCSCFWSFTSTVRCNSGKEWITTGFSSDHPPIYLMDERARLCSAAFSTSPTTFKVRLCIEKSLGGDSRQLFRPFGVYWSAVSELLVLGLTWSGCRSAWGSVSCSSRWRLVAQRSAGCDRDTIPPWSRASQKMTRVQFRPRPGCCRTGRGTPAQGPCVQKRNLHTCSEQRGKVRRFPSGKPGWVLGALWTLFMCCDA